MMIKRRSLCLCCLLLALALSAFAALAEVAPPKAHLNYDNKGGKLILRAAESALDLIIPSHVSEYPVSEIAANAFWDSPNMTRVTIPSTVSYISPDAFAGCTKLGEFVVADGNSHYSAFGGALYDEAGETLIRVPEGLLGELPVPPTLKSVEDGAFENCVGLTEVRFPEGLLQIGNDAFRGCTSLKTVALPASLESLPQSSPFAHCPALTQLSVAKGNPLYSAKSGALYGTSGTTLIAYPSASGEQSLPAGVELIKDGAFAGASALTGLSLPATLYEIGPSAFMDCVALTRLDIPDGAALIGHSAFSGCSALEVVSVPASVLSIGDDAFPEGVAIQCMAQSFADEYAQQRGLKRLRLDAQSGEARDADLERSAEPEQNEAPEEIPEQSAPPAVPPEAQGVDAAILSALGDELINQTYVHLAQGASIKKGDKAPELSGLQNLLNLLGAQLTVDGSIGAKSIAALNEAQAAYQLDKSQTVSLAEYQALLACAFIAKDPESARELLGEADAQRIDYTLATSAYKAENFFTAYQLFTALGDYQDSAKQAESCPQQRPQNGQLHAKDALKNAVSELSIVTSLDHDLASYIKVCAADGQLVTSAFIAGADKVTLKIPSGTYLIKVGTGRTWFGVNEAFGREHEGSLYSTLTFAGGGDSARFEPNYRYTLTLGGAADNNVNSRPEDPDAF